MTEKWFQMWMDDKESIIRTMERNMNNDLSVGYDPNGQSITEQKKSLADYVRDFHDTLMSFADMDEKKRNRWCYYDLIRRGVIER